MAYLLALTICLWATALAEQVVVKVNDESSFTVYNGQQCWGFDSDLLRDFEGTAAECLAKCIELGDNCVGFVRVNEGSQYAGKCYFRSTALEEPYDYDADDRDCFIRNEHFRAYEGQQCWGTEDDLLRDFEGTAAECQAKCIELGEDCVGFIRVNDGSQYAEKCYFRSTGLQDPYDYEADNRDCFVRNAFAEFDSSQFTVYDGQQCWGTEDDLERDFEATAAECLTRCIELGEECVGFVRVNDGSQYAGKCYFRSTGLEAPYDYTNDDRDCFARNAAGETNTTASISNDIFTVYEGYQCAGTKADLLRNFEGTAEECKEKCIELGEECVGFVRVNDGSKYAGKCYFRTPSLETPQVYTGDDRDCFVRDALESGILGGADPLSWTGYNVVLTLSAKDLAIVLLSITTIAMMLILIGQCQTGKGKQRAKYGVVKVMDSEME